MWLAEDQHPVGDLCPGREYEPFRISVRGRASGRDFRCLDAGAGQGRIERFGELPGAVADQEPVARCAVTEVHQEIPDLLGCPRAVRVRGDPENVHVAGTRLDDEEAVQALERYRAVDVEEIGGEHGRSLGGQELSPGRVGVPFRCRGDLQGPEDPADGGRADQVAEF
jgi:hypothetical protein